MIVQVRGVESTRVTGTLMATYTTVAAYSAQPIRSRFSDASTRKKTPAISTSCQM